jgi:hypothetical protein
MYKNSGHVKCQTQHAGPLTFAKKVDEESSLALSTQPLDAHVMALSCGQRSPCDELFANKVAVGNRMSYPAHAPSSRSFDRFSQRRTTAVCTAQSVRRDDLDKLALHRR